MTCLRLIPYQGSEGEGSPARLDTNRQPCTPRTETTVQHWLDGSPSEPSISPESSTFSSEATVSSTDLAPQSPLKLSIPQTDLPPVSATIMPSPSRHPPSKQQPSALSPSKQSTHHRSLTSISTLPSALTTLQQSTKASRDLEALHAYDIGVCAALRSMELHWESLAAQRHVSNSERRIFRREAQRLRELLVGAEADTRESDEVLEGRKEKEEGAWKGVWRLVEGEESGCVASVGERETEGAVKAEGTERVERLIGGMRGLSFGEGRKMGFEGS